MNGLPRGRELLAVSFMLVGLMGSGLPARAGPAQPLVLEQKIPLGEVSGRIDHLAVDLPRQRLFVAELGNNSLGVLDLAAGKLLRRIGGLAEPQGVAYDPASDTVFVADAGDGVVHRFTGAGLTPLDPLRLGSDADNVRLAPKDGQVVVGYGEGALALISAASGKLDAKIPLPGHPESFQLERGGTRIFVNVPDAQQIVVVDRGTGQQVAGWSIADAGANFPMALDEANGRLMVVYRKPALLAVFDTRSGAPLARLPACGDTDDVFLDASASASISAAARASSRSSSSTVTPTRSWHASRPWQAPGPRCSFPNAIVSISRSGPAAARAQPSGSSGPRRSE